MSDLVPICPPLADLELAEAEMQILAMSQAMRVILSTSGRNDPAIVLVCKDVLAGTLKRFRQLRRKKRFAWMWALLESEIAATAAELKQHRNVRFPSS